MDESWKGNEQYLVFKYLDRLERLADGMPHFLRPVTVRFSPKELCAQFVDKSGIVKAEVTISGKDGVPSQLMVYSRDVELGQKVRKEFPDLVSGFCKTG